MNLRIQDYKQHKKMELGYHGNDGRNSYGEENSLGPGTGLFIYKSLVDVIIDLQ